MGKRHNRKRTRSRPRNREGSTNTDSQHFRRKSVDTSSSYSTTTSSYGPVYAPISNIPADHWQQTYFAWKNRLQFEQERARAVEMQQLRIFGGEPGDGLSLLEPMMKVVTDLFDGDDDFGYT